MSEKVQMDARTRVYVFKKVLEHVDAPSDLWEDINEESTLQRLRPVYQAIFDATKFTGIPCLTTEVQCRLHYQRMIAMDIVEPDTFHGLPLRYKDVLRLKGLWTEGPVKSRLRFEKELGVMVIMQAKEFIKHHSQE